MFQRLLTTVSFLLAAAPLGLALPAGGEGWQADFDAAVKVAKAEKKDLFVDFTGSDWCIWCKRLDAEVFAHEAFLTAAKRDFVLVALDFPNDEKLKEKVPNPKRNEELQHTYGVQGFPTVLLMTAEGVVYGQMGYQKGGPEQFVKDLTAQREKGKQELAKYQALVDGWTQAADEAAQMKAWDELAAVLAKDGATSRAARLLIGPVRKALAFDAEKQRARRIKAVEVLLGAGEQDKELMQLGYELDPKNEAGLYERCVEALFRQVNDLDVMKEALAKLDALVALGPRKNKQIDFDLHANAAYFYAQHLNDKERAKAYAKTAKEIGTDNPNALEFLEGILGS